MALLNRLTASSWALADIIIGLPLVSGLLIAFTMILDFKVGLAAYFAHIGEFAFNLNNGRIGQQITPFAIGIVQLVGKDRGSGLPGQTILFPIAVAITLGMDIGEVAIVYIFLRSIKKRLT